MYGRFLQLPFSILEYERADDERGPENVRNTKPAPSGKLSEFKNLVFFILESYVSFRQFPGRC